MKSPNSVLTSLQNSFLSPFISLSFCSTQFAPNQEDMKACHTRRQRFPYLTEHSFNFGLSACYLFTDVVIYRSINIWSANNRRSVCGVISVSRFLSGGTEENSEKPQSRTRSWRQELRETDLANMRQKCCGLHRIVRSIILVPLLYPVGSNS